MNKNKIKRMKKNLKKTSLSKEMQDDILYRMKMQLANPIKCYEGEKVKLDYDRIISYPDWERLRPEYKNFVQSNKDKIFTVEFDPLKVLYGDENMDTMVQLLEDTTNPKFLFWAGDLIPVHGNNQETNLKERKFKEYMDEVDNKIKELSSNEN